MVRIHDPNDEVPEEGAIVHHGGHYKSPYANVPNEYVDEENLEYEPKYSGEVVDRTFDSGQIMVWMNISSTEDEDFLTTGDRIGIAASIINEKEYYTVEEP